MELWLTAATFKGITRKNLPNTPIMNYKEIVEQILKYREELVCVETNLMQDFSGADSTPCFAVWCEANQLSCFPLTGKGPKKLLLKKTAFLQTPVLCAM